MMQQGWALLDIRPPTETQKFGIAGAVSCSVIYESSDTFLAGEMMQQGWALLDIRPPTETQKVGIVSAVTCSVL
jgi:rhodanese-related sulfurtransferase